ncbi:toprim domain-containing protein, partial [Vibrio cholerae]
KVEQVYLGKHPAILSLISYSDGKVATIHRTYLGQNGQKIRFDEEGLTVESKMIMSRCEPRLLTGGAIQLASINTDIMHIAEGVETTLAVRQVLAYRGINEPVWSCVSSTLLQGFEPPKGIKHVVVWADKDTKKLIRGKMKEAGLDAATELAFRL